MTRAAVLPTPGDPFLNKLWFKLFEKYWQNEVDKLYVLVNSKIEDSVVNFLRGMYTSNPKVVFLYRDHMIEHGWALKELILACKEDLIMLVEDDGMIFKSGAVKEQFDRIESGEVDVIGGHRQSSTPKIAEAVQRKFYTADLESFLWPNFLFTKTKYLMKTDLEFGAKGFKAGETVPILEAIFEEDQAMDTFGWATIQLYAQNLNVDYIEQHHSMAEDLMFYEQKQRMWAGGCKWVHWGSLSSMMTNFLLDKDGKPLESRTYITETKDPYDIKNSDPMENDGVKQDFESRVANTMLAFELTEKECDEISDFREEYREALYRLIQVFHLRMDQVLKRMRIYKELMEL